MKTFLEILRNTKEFNAKFWCKSLQKSVTLTFGLQQQQQQDIDNWPEAIQ